MNKASLVPGHIREIRDCMDYPLDDFFIEDFETIILKLERWLADPTVPDELRAGDAEILEVLRTHLAIRRAVIEAEGQTRH